MIGIETEKIAWKGIEQFITGLAENLDMTPSQILEGIVLDYMARKVANSKAGQEAVWLEYLMQEDKSLDHQRNFNVLVEQYERSQKEVEELQERYEDLIDIVYKK